MGDFRTTKVSFQTFMSITNSNGVFATWTDIKEKMLSSLLYSGEILNTKVRQPEEIIGNNIIFKNTENKNITRFYSDITKMNNKLTEDKMVMNLYTDYMMALEIEILDKKSCIEWSELISSTWESLMISKQDLENQLAIDEIQKVCIALGNVKIIKNTDNLSKDYTKNKNLAAELAADRIKNRTRRTKFMKGYPKELERFFVSSTLSLNLLTGLTSSSASSEAYADTKNRFEVIEVFGHRYETTPMYLGQDINMSEFIPETGGTVSDKQNVGEMTGQLVKPFFFKDLQGLLFIDESVAFYSQTFEERILPSPMVRTKDVMTIPFRMDVAIKPIYAGINKAYFSKIPTYPSYVDLKGNVIPARDLSKKADYDAFVNEVYNSQPQLYSMFGWNGASNVDQAELTKMWKDAEIVW